MRNIAAAFAAPVAGPVQIPASEIDEALFLYRSEFRYVAGATFDSGAIEAVFSEFEYPYARVPIRHLTREQAVVFISQAAYLMAFRSAASGALGTLTTARLSELCLAERAVFTRIDLRFRKLLENRSGISLRLCMDGVRRISSRIFLAMSFEFEKGECHGSCDAMIRA